MSTCSPCTPCSAVLTVPSLLFFFFQAEDGIRDTSVTGVQTCALPICHPQAHPHPALDRGCAVLGPEHALLAHRDQLQQRGPNGVLERRHLAHGVAELLARAPRQRHPIHAHILAMGYDRNRPMSLWILKRIRSQSKTAHRSRGMPYGR